MKINEKSEVKTKENEENCCLFICSLKERAYVEKRVKFYREEWEITCGRELSLQSSLSEGSETWRRRECYYLYYYKEKIEEE